MNIGGKYTPLNLVTVDIMTTAMTKKKQMWQRLESNNICYSTISLMVKLNIRCDNF